MLWKKILARLPSRKDLWPVYALIVFMVYTWSFFFSFWELPSWSMFMTVGELLAVFCYVMSLSLLESLIFLAVLSGLCFLFPPSWLKEHFIVRGSSISFSLLAGMMVYWYFIFPDHSIISFVYILVWTVIVAIAVEKVKWMRLAALWLSERLTIFLYLYLPLSLISLIVVVYRNLV